MQGIESRLSRRPLSRAIAMALGIGGAGAAWAQSVAGNELEEVVVTATRRTENLQDVPIAITALTSNTLSELNVQTLEDFVKYLPNVSTAGTGPGQNEVYMRGLSTTHQGTQVVGGTGTFPNVAVYLDDQSVQLPGRNLDVYAADLARIEVLEGPQGTLYGAGAQAGAVRYITNKPKLDVTEGAVDASYSTTAHGDPNASGVAMINIPVIADTLALRAVIYNDSRGGYIHNIPGTFTRSPTDLGIVSYFGGVVPPGSTSLSNYPVVSNAFNPVTYQGARLSAFYRFNDDWNVLLQQSYQNMEADGVFAYNPQLGDLEVQQYNPSVDKDKFEDTAWTLNGRAGPLKLVYTGGYLVRNVDQTADYTAYSRGPFAAYYQCNIVATPTAPATCYSPSATWHNIERNTHQSHEFRVSTPDEDRVRGIAGIFWEEFNIQTSQNFLYADPQAGFPPLTLQPGVEIFDNSTRVAGTAFVSDITRGYKQEAAFGEVAFDIIPHSLTLTAGTRFFRFDNFDRGQSDSVYGCRNVRSLHPREWHLRSVQFLADQLRSQEQGQPELEAHGRCVVVCHLLRGLQTRRLQPRRRFDSENLAALRHIQCAAFLRQRYAQELRDRLEDAVVRPPSAIQRRGVRRGMVERAAADLRSDVVRQFRIHGERPELPRARRRGRCDLPHHG